jgi:hypothetical protein
MRVHILVEISDRTWEHDIDHDEVMIPGSNRHLDDAIQLLDRCWQETRAALVALTSEPSRIALLMNQSEIKEFQAWMKDTGR